MIIPVSVGGGLNLKVVGGTSAPSSPKENTVWVNTSTAISGYAFSATAPTSPVAGMVWFSTGTDSPAAMNVAKKNTVMLYPTDCKQYIAGVWVKKEATTYQNGAWVDLATYLYNEGDLCSALTGGWKGVNNYSDAGYSIGTLTKNASSIKLTAPSPSSVITAQTTKKISLAGFNTLKINLTAYSGGTGRGAWVGIFSSDGTNPVASLDITSKGTKSLDISKFSTGSYYVGIECVAESNASGSCTLTFDKLWLE